MISKFKPINENCKINDLIIETQVKIKENENFKIHHIDVLKNIVSIKDENKKIYHFDFQCARKLFEISQSNNLNFDFAIIQIIHNIEIFNYNHKENQLNIILTRLNKINKKFKELSKLEKYNENYIFIYFIMSSLFFQLLFIKTDFNAKQINEELKENTFLSSLNNLQPQEYKTKKMITSDQIGEIIESCAFVFNKVNKSTILEIINKLLSTIFYILNQNGNTIIETKKEIETGFLVNGRHVSKKENELKEEHDFYQNKSMESRYKYCSNEQLKIINQKLFFHQCLV